MSPPPPNILVGTSGYSYRDWKGPFYPADIKDGDMLAFYACRFAAVEINFTYYRLPTPRTVAGIVRKGPALRYAVKLTGDATHEGKLTKESAADFRRGVAPMAEAGVLGCILAQFPWRFKYSPAAEEVLEKLAAYLGDLNVVAEFRHCSWAEPEVFEKLAKINVGFCNVDEPSLKGLMPATGEATSRVGYFRFHGRNAKKWWRHEKAAERYDYLYNREQLAEWVPRIRDVASRTEKTYVFMNNHPRGQAVANAEMMREMLGGGVRTGGGGGIFLERNSGRRLPWVGRR